MNNTGNNNTISRRRKAYTIMAAIASVLCVQGIITGIRTSQLKHQISSLETSVTATQKSYTELTIDYEQLQKDYNKLQDDYKELAASHEELVNEVNEVKTYGIANHINVDGDPIPLANHPTYDEMFGKDDGALKPHLGVNQGPQGKETWYDLDMDGVLYLMNDLGYTYEEYPYWVREDGVKMFGDYIMVAADLKIWPKGTILECSLGTAMVVDTGYLKPYQLDIATDWDKYFDDNGELIV